MGIHDAEAQGLRFAGLRVRRFVCKSQEEQIKFLRKLVNRYRSDPTVRDKAEQIVFQDEQLPPKAKAAHALAIGRWTQRAITYVNEGSEEFSTPLRILTHRYGDCDDHATINATLCEALGIPTELVGLGWTDRGKAELRHIFCRAVVPDPRTGLQVRLPLDSTLNAPIDALTDPIQIAIGRGQRPFTFVA